MVPGMTHIGHYLTLNTHSEQIKAPEVGGGAYNEAPVASAVSEQRGTKDGTGTHQTILRNCSGAL